jgi:hypothetical protein
MDFLTIVISFAMGVVLFLMLLGLTWVVERTSSAESAGRSVSGSTRSG